ncbi:MAG: phage tail length tape measure family protein, partial [Rhodospirillales bacterium]|nr:phage tail length tape measure family protein [Rhodospirillales bacterium]
GAASVKQSTDAMRATVADEAAAFNAAVQSKIDAQIRLNTAFAGGITSTAGIAEAEAALDQAMAAGAITASEYAGYIDTLSASEAVLAGATEADTAAIVENTGAKVLNARVSGELGTMLGEVLSGNFGRLRRSAGALANQSGLLARAFTGMGPPILAAAGAVIAFGVAIVKGAEEQAKFNGALLMTGGSTGVLAGDLQDMTERVGEASGSFGNAKEAMLAIVQSGRITGDEMQSVGIAAQQMAALTGESIQKSVDAFVKLQEKPVQAVAALNDKYHFLTTAIFDQIAALQKQGDTEGAAKLATEAYAKALEDRSTQVQGSLGLLARSWDSVKSSASFAWDAMLNVGKASTLQDKIGNAQTALEHFQKMGLVDFNVKAGHVGWETTSKGKNDSGAQYEIDNLKKLQAQLAEQQQAATKQSGSDAAVTQHADAVAKVIDKHHALTKAITDSGAAERKAAQEATNALDMQRIGTQANTAERIQADAAMLASATKLYGADSSQQVAALRQMLSDEKSYDASVVKARKDALAAISKEELKNAALIKKSYDEAYAASAKSWHL